MPFRSRHSLIPGLLVCLVALTSPAVTRGDQIIVQGASPLKVTVTGFANNRLSYQTGSGGTGERDYAKLQQIVVDNEPALNAAEAGVAAGRAEAAVDDYVKAVRGTTTPWVKVFAARRLLDAAGPAGRFEPRLTAYLALLTLAPTDAVDRRPALPEPGSRLLDVAVLEIESALKPVKLAEAPKVALLDFLTDVHRRRGDEAAVVATVERLANASPAAANSPAVQAQLIGLKITQAKAAMEKKDYAAAVRLINDARATIVDPAHQSDALFILASARLAQADPADASAQQDAAVAFMRVVAHAQPLPGRPNVLASLRQVAGILERTGDAAGAAKINGQVARDFPRGQPE